ncbi:MAG: DUF975 family protein [Eubacteriales bacterium]
MWTRAELKDKAKDILKTTYWKSLLVSIIIAFAGGGGGGSVASTQGSGNTDQFNYEDYSGLGTTIDWNAFLREYLPVIIIGIIIFLVIILFILSLRIFLGFPLEIGGRKFFVQGAREDANLNYMGYAFNKDRYFNIIKTMFLKGLYTFLWTLLFIIPGIIAAYSYYMVPYLLTDNPGMGSKRVIQLSKELTQGHKLDIFVLELSFIGWYILCFIPAYIGIINGWFLLDFAAMIGIFLIAPYVNATKAQLYLKLRNYGIENGITTEEELIQ